jgi:uncharacterized SAM-binding protein YcdF (DUF218 family)
MSWLRRHRPILAVLGFCLAVLPLAWLAGLVWFAAGIPSSVPDENAFTDAIVVLTGGSLRVDSGLTLLLEGKAKRLFVSGVHQGVGREEMLRVSRQTPSWVACCVDLGHEAESTQGNALETREWMHRQRFRSLRLVTASYHMRRSLLEFHRVMPEITIIAHPVFPERVKQSEWWAWPGTASLIVGEYNKYLGALARPAARVLQDGQGAAS